MSKPWPFIMFSLALSLAACGGGSSGGGIVPSGGSTPVPQSTPTPTPTPSSGATPAVVAGTGAPLTGTETYKGAWTSYGVAHVLDFPVQHGWNGSGQNVGIVIDSDVDRSIIQAYVTQAGLPMPSITTVSIDGATGIPSQNAAKGDETEAYLDVETVAGLAPGAHIYVYQIPDLNDQSIADGYSKLDSDGIVKVANSSFGGCESANSPEDPFILKGAQAGITYVASGGDNGNVCDGVSKVGANWPASNPNVVGVGGTETNVANADPLTNAVVWNDSACQGGQCAGGGGVSTIYPLPSYQVGLSGATSTTHRNVPDLSLPAEDDSMLQASWFAINGTSWSAPEYAALMAEVLQYCHVTAGFANPASIPYYVASHYPKAYIDVTQGNDQFGTTTPYYTAAAGYDNASGFGVPYGMAYANTVCPGGTKASGLAVRSAMSAPAQPVRAAAPLDVTPRMQGVTDQGPRPEMQDTRIQIVLGSEADRSAVEAALQEAGFTIDRRFEYRDIVHAGAPSGIVGRFFGTQMHNVLQPRYGIRYAPGTAIALPGTLAGHVAAVSLDNVVARRVMSQNASSSSLDLP